MKTPLILVLFLLSTIIYVNGQTSEESRLEYCKDHWREAPDMCSDFIPKEYYEEKASQGELTNEDIKKLDELEASHFGFVNCPAGSHQKAVSGEKIICVDDNDPRIIVEPISEQTNISFDSVYIVAGIAIVIIIIIITALKSRGKSTSPQQQYVPRREFSWTTKEMVKVKQGGRCAKCGKFPTHWEFHHKAGRDNNDISNCMGLCHDCHDDVTY